jgi:ribonuclease D
LKVLTTSLQTPIADQPELRVASANLPPLKIWKEKNPIGYARLTHVRAALLELSAHLQIPTENLITPEIIKRICWQEPPPVSSEYEDFVNTELERLGARPWQVEQVAHLVAANLGATEPLVIPDQVETESQNSPEEIA